VLSDLLREDAATETLAQFAALAGEDEKPVDHVQQAIDAAKRVVETQTWVRAGGPKPFGG
jgi:hypothetical protein